MIETKPRIATVDNCLELGGSRQHGVASQQTAEQPTRVECSTKCTSQGFRMGPNSDINPSTVIACDRHEQLNKGLLKY